MGTIDGATGRTLHLAHGGRLAFAAACLAVLLAGCSGSPQNHTGPTTGVFVTTATSWKSAEPSVPVYITVSALALDTGQPRWQHREEYSPYHQPMSVIVSNGVVYFAADTNTTSTDPKHPISGDMIALRASDGSQLWRTEIGSLASAPLLDGDTLYVTAAHISGSTITKVAYALNKNDGSIHWQTTLPSTFGVNDALALGDGNIIITSNTSCFDSCGNVDLFAVSISNGQLAWHQTLTGALTAQPPIIDGDHVFVRVRGFFGEDSATSGCYLLTYNIADGHERWRYQASSCDFVFANGEVYATQSAGVNPSNPFTGSYTVVALDGATGAQRYAVPTDFAPQLLAVNNGRLYLQHETQDLTSGTPVYGEDLNALDATSGALLWKKPIGSQDVNCQIGANAIYVGSPPSSAPGQGSLAAYDLASGKQLWHEPIGSSSQGGVGPGILAPPGDLIFAFDNVKGAIYALHTNGGGIVWSFAAPAENTFQGLTVSA